MKLSELVAGLAEVSADVEITGLALDSRQLSSGFAFIALAGAVQHGMEYVHQVLAKGAVAVIYDPAGKGAVISETLSGVNMLAVPALAQHLGEIAARFYGHPSQSVDVIGVTGTNGKTSCSQFLAQVLDCCGVIGTMGWGAWGELQNTLNTTPDVLTIQNMLNTFVVQQKKTVVMEVSSHGLQQGRVNGICFKGALFTNLSRDHLDYHGNMDDYLAAKLKLFACPSLKFVVLNLDDSSAGKLIKQCRHVLSIWGFSRKGVVNAELETVLAKNIKHSLNGIQFDVCWQNYCRTVKTSLVGSFNLENVLAVLTVLLATGLSLDKAVQRLAVLKAINGRMEHFGGGNKPTVFVDYAHSPDALEKVLLGLRADCHNKLSVIFGCGGNRDKGKRGQMGAVAEKWADEVILTDDNPRNEQPEMIINDILSGCCTDKVRVIHDRERAIKTVIDSADKKDCIVIAGKGHEHYQEVTGVRLPFSDQQVVRKALTGWGG